MAVNEDMLTFRILDLKRILLLSMARSNSEETMISIIQL